MSLENYILDDAGNPVLEPDVFKFVIWWESTDRHLADTYVGRVRVSTVFLRTDHQFVPGGEPILWETLVFGGSLDGEMDRYGSREDALTGHKLMVERVAALN